MTFCSRGLNQTAGNGTGILILVKLTFKPNFSTLIDAFTDFAKDSLPHAVLTDSNDFAFVPVDANYTEFEGYSYTFSRCSK